MKFTGRGSLAFAADNRRSLLFFDLSGILSAIGEKGINIQAVAKRSKLELAAEDERKFKCVLFSSVCASRFSLKLLLWRWGCLDIQCF